MTYDIWTKDDDEHSAELEVREMSNGGVIYSIECLGKDCNECCNDEHVYRVCPECGARVDYTIDQPYICGCGTTLWVCGPSDNCIVSIYSKPVKEFTVSEDTI